MIGFDESIVKYLARINQCGECHNVVCLLSRLGGCFRCDENRRPALNSAQVIHLSNKYNIGTNFPTPH
jgi:hypothetical protein